MSKILLAAASFFLIQAISQAQEQDPIAKKITAAQDAFHAERDKAEQALIMLLERKENLAKQAGDIKTLSVIQEESAAFRSDGKLPRSVPLTMYLAAMRSAKTRLEVAYSVAIKSYIQKNSIEQAKAAQTDLERFLKTHEKSLPVADAFTQDSIWKSEKGEKNILTVLSRQGSEFVFRHEYETGRGQRFREGKGTIEDGKLIWLKKDLTVIKGDTRTQDFQGLLSKDDKGDLLDISWTEDKTYHRFLRRVK